MIDTSCIINIQAGTSGGGRQRRHQPVLGDRHVQFADSVGRDAPHQTSVRLPGQRRLVALLLLLDLHHLEGFVAGNRGNLGEPTSI